MIHIKRGKCANEPKTLGSSSNTNKYDALFNYFVSFIEYNIEQALGRSKSYISITVKLITIYFEVLTYLFPQKYFYIYKKKTNQ